MRGNVRLIHEVVRFRVDVENPVLERSEELADVLDTLVVYDLNQRALGIAKARTMKLQLGRSHAHL